MSHFPFVVGISIALTALAGCGTVSDTQTGTTISTAVEYETLSSDAAVTSTLGGVALKFKEDPDETSLSTSSGTLTHNTGATTLDDGTYKLVDPDGYAANGLLSDGVSALVSIPAQGFSSSYEYARVYYQGYVDGTTPYSVKGIYGVVTREADMPSSGRATFSGEAVGTYSDGTANYDLNGGSSSIIANFGSGNVTVAMEGFEAVDRATGDSEDVGFDAVRIDAMNISGNQFSGGTITTQNGGTTVGVVGTRTQQTAIGRFFGLNSSGTPDEAGGIGYLEGTDGSVTTIFLAD